jgi:hypothetical protein
MCHWCRWMKVLIHRFSKTSTSMSGSLSDCNSSKIHVLEGSACADSHHEVWVSYLTVNPSILLLVMTLQKYWYIFQRKVYQQRYLFVPFIPLGSQMVMIMRTFESLYNQAYELHVVSLVFVLISYFAFKTQSLEWKFHFNILNCLYWPMARWEDAFSWSRKHACGLCP